jgi:hypothetical protein
MRDEVNYRVLISLAVDMIVRARMILEYLPPEKDYLLKCLAAALDNLVLFYKEIEKEACNGN